MRNNRVDIPLRELTQTQLIGVIHRLQDEIDDFYRKNDAEIRRENQRLHTTIWRQFAELEQIAEALITHGHVETRAGAMAQSIRKILHKLQELEKK